MEYKYVKCLKFCPGGNIDCVLTEPIPCSINYFIQAFWMPIKHQIGEKLVFLPGVDRRHFSLFYNQIAAIGDVSLPSPEQIEFCKQDSEKIIEVALRHIDTIMEHLYCKEPHDDIVPLVDEYRPIKSVDDETITLNGRLPMQEQYFIKKYWTPIADYHHARNKGIRFRIHFSEHGTKVSISAELCRYNAFRAKQGLPKCDNNAIVGPQLQAIMTDLADVIITAAFDYAEACRKVMQKPAY